MKTILKTTLCLLTCAALFACTQNADTSDQTTLDSLSFAAAPGDDAPELAQLGPYRVGVQTREFSYPDQADIGLAAFVTGNPPKQDRKLSVDIIYPAALTDDTDDTEPNAIYPGIYKTGLTKVAGLPPTFEVRGMAVRDAQPISGDNKFPLVIVSHGLHNRPGVLSGLTENLASKGYIVAAIDHFDDFPQSDNELAKFARVLLNRSLDQQRILTAMQEIASSGSDLGKLIDAESIGIVGFSMGGYGVLNHAGAGLNPEGETYGMVPGDALQSQTEGDADFVARQKDHIDAVVAFAPWGGQPDANMFTNSALADIRAPLLLFAGDQDDISNYEEGIKRIFNKSSGTERYMLVFQNAMHNLVQIPAPPSAHLDVVPWQTFEDPTWRREKLISVGAHFMTAFFDLHLKGYSSRLDYLDLATEASNDGVWEQPMLEDYSDLYADGGEDSKNYWRGFKRRQALGLEMHKLKRGETR